MSQSLEETSITPPSPTVTAPTVQTPTVNAEPAQSATTEPVAPVTEKEPDEKKPTTYVVLAGASEEGPWEKVGTFEGHGQTAAKKAAVTALTEQGTNANDYWFLAIPVSSYVPEKPQVKVTTVVSF